MLRDTAIRELDHEPDFTWRGQNVTRIENLSDIVFALAFGMLVASSAPPATFTELVDFLIAIVPVTAAFYLLVMIWSTHYTFFRRYGIVDNHVIVLNAILLFVVLYLAFPLRFAFDSFFGYVLLALGHPERVDAMGVSLERSGLIMGFFAAGYLVVQLLFSGLYAHALRLKASLSLSPREIALTRRTVAMTLVMSALACIVGLLAVFTDANGFAGFLINIGWPLNWVVNHLIKLPD
ncbi:MAG: TMEM175 family protein [Pseudomonadota bacterium]